MVSPAGWPLAWKTRSHSARAAAGDGDADHYLGDDYPFFARSVAPADLEMALATATAAFGGPDWERARAIMTQVAARSTDAHVRAEFRSMVEEVTR